MGPVIVVVVPQKFDLLPGIFEAEKPVDVQAFIAEAAIERLDERIVGGLAWPAERELHSMLVRPLVQCFADELAAVIGLDALGQPVERHQALHKARDVTTADVLLG